MAKCKNCKHFYKRPDITMFTCAEGKPHEDNTVIDCENYAPMTNADRIRRMTDEELAGFLKEVKEDYQWANPDYPDCEDYGEWLEWLQSEAEMEE